MRTFPLTTLHCSLIISFSALLSDRIGNAFILQTPLRYSARIPCCSNGHWLLDDKNRNLEVQPWGMKQTPCTLLSSRMIREYDLDDDFDKDIDWPFDDKVDFQRLDEEDDSEFYSKPRFVNHIDEWAVLSLRTYYENELSELLTTTTTTPTRILDLCSSWTSHLDNNKKNDGRIVFGVGMNEEELEANVQLESYVVQDLNKNPSLSSFAKDESYDVVTLALSVDYLTNPRVVFQEIYRVLKPGGMALIPVSNRYFRKKAIQKWLNTESDEGRLDIVASYFFHSPSNKAQHQWQSIQTSNIKLEFSPLNIQQFVLNQNLFRWFATSIFRGSWRTDPLYIIKAIK